MMYKTRQRMKDKITMQSNIFSHMSGIPWDVSIASQLDLLYYTRSAEKYVSPLVDNIQSAAGQLTEDSLISLAGACVVAFGSKWSHIWQAMTASYNPIENYSMTETGTDETEKSNDRTKSGSDETAHAGSDTMSKTGTDTYASSGTDTDTNTKNLTHAKTGTETEANTGTNTRNLYGFNTSNTDGVPDSKSSNTDSATTTYNTQDKDTGTDTRQYVHGKVQTETKALNDTTTYGKRETVSYGSRDHEEGTDTTAHSLTRSGNIGVTTTQEMITQEILLRKENNFFLDIVFPDVDRLLTLTVY